ncbi:MAG: hypothetical protein ACJAS4_000021 [Bacteriovoracaceae bacterium]|jgi:hypothetical protein
MLYIYTFFTLVGCFYTYQFDRDENLKIFFKRRELLISSISLMLGVVQIVLIFFGNGSINHDVYLKLLFTAPFLGVFVFELFRKIVNK